jgi:hypothetical protein
MSHMAAKTWSDTLTPRLDEMRADLISQDIATVASLTGAALEGATIIRIRLWDDDWLVRWPDGTIQGRAGQACSPDKQVMLLHYLTRADGTTPGGRWIAFHELPGGMFYAQAFQGYSGNRLALSFVNNVEAFDRAAQSLGGQPVDIGDSAFAFWPLPRLALAAQYWLGDDEFAPRANILFDASAGHYLTTDGLAVLGSQLVSRLIKSPRAKYDM